MKNMIMKNSGLSIFLLLVFRFLPVSAQIPPSVGQHQVTPGGDETYSMHALQVKPEYKGGMEAFYKFIGANFAVPEPDIEDDFKAKIFTTFVVEKDGTISDIKVIRDPGFGLGKEAVRVITATSGSWSPGVQNGKPVRTSFALPFVINVPGTGKKKAPIENQTDED
ncbi:energy transducer TonB [uncultured Flavobacterium sp.]|uniref:energy transducer TonB n=1 Tax=uncultured Flavobacterium sp. TaxID=165435 RepID=UPI0025E5EDF9|nr:energy transducer TonB [uncultured Flavobacterium sp.]